VEIGKGDVASANVGLIWYTFLLMHTGSIVSFISENVRLIMLPSRVGFSDSIIHRFLAYESGKHRSIHISGEVLHIFRCLQLNSDYSSVGVSFHPFTPAPQPFLDPLLVV
jgi:hypothetical protein